MVLGIILIIMIPFAFFIVGGFDPDMWSCGHHLFESKHSKTLKNIARLESEMYPDLPEELRWVPYPDSVTLWETRHGESKSCKVCSDHWQDKKI